MGFEVQETEIAGLLKIKPHIFEDKRGIYLKYFEKNIFKELRVQNDFTETSDIYSTKGVLRGLHYQTKNSQAKLIHVVKGLLFDVAVDLRLDSATFGKVHSELLDSEKHEMLFIPKDFAHGFISLSDETVFSYQCSGTYLLEYCGGIRWDDSDLKINWPLKDYGIKDVVLSEKDESLPSFADTVEKILKERCSNGSTI